MKVFVPHLETKNVYFDEIIKYSTNDFIFSHYSKYDSSFNIVNIQFPEAIFEWNIPSFGQLKDLELSLQEWKRHSKIVCTLNDFKSHYDEENSYEKLFALLYRYVDAVIHLGNYSLQEYKKYFPSNTLHTVIYHPLYSSLLTQYEKKELQEIIPIKLDGKFVVSVIGGIRSKEEMKFILKIFKKIPINNKILLVPRMLEFIKPPSFLPYRFRKIWRKIIVIKHTYPLKPEQYYFKGTFLDYQYVIDLMHKSSLMIIPRIRNLNSGNLFLGLTFDTPMIIPNIGNLTEVAKLFDLPLFDLKRNNLEEVFKSVLNTKYQSYSKTTEYIYKKKMFHPQKIAYEYDSFFDLIIKNC